MPLHSQINTTDIEHLKTGVLDHRAGEVLCRMCKFAYERTELDLRDSIGNGWDHLTVWLSENQENQGYLVWNDGVAVLVFRGTNSRADWRLNAQAFFPDRHSLGGRRHDGFEIAWKQTPDDVLTTLSDVVASNTRLWITGHSLGGAIATACAASFLLNKPTNIAEDFKAVTFGSPRFGNDDFVAAYNARMPNRHWFYANEKDPVPHLPTNFMGYAHVGALQYFNASGDLTEISLADAGLQAGDESTGSANSATWNSVENDLRGVGQTRAHYNAFIDSLGVQFEAEQIFEENLARGELQGASGWTTAAHSLAVYAQRLQNLLA